MKCPIHNIDMDYDSDEYNMINMWYCTICEKFYTKEDIKETVDRKEN